MSVQSYGYSDKFLKDCWVCEQCDTLNSPVDLFCCSCGVPFDFSIEITCFVDGDDIYYECGGETPLN